MAELQRSTEHSGDQSLLVASRQSFRSAQCELTSSDEDLGFWGGFSVDFGSLVFQGSLGVVLLSGLLVVPGG